MDSEFPNCSQRWFPKDSVKAHTHRHVCSAAACHTWSPAAGTRQEKGLHEIGTCTTSEGARSLQDLQSHSGIISLASVTSWQQSNKIPLYFSNAFNQSFIHLNECERKETGNTFTLGKQSKRRLCKMPSVTLTNPGGSPRLDFFFFFKCH